MMVLSLIFSSLLLLYGFDGAVAFEFAVSPELNALCVGIRNSDECAQKIEQYQLRSNTSRAQRRRHDELVIRLDKSKHISLKDKNPDEDGQVFRYIEYLPAIKHHLVLIHYSEEIEFLLISQNTGKPHKIPNVPHIALEGNI
jgi:hypothetical protein